MEDCNNCKYVGKGPFTEPCYGCTPDNNKWKPISNMQSQKSYDSSEMIAMLEKNDELVFRNQDGSTTECDDGGVYAIDKNGHERHINLQDEWELVPQEVSLTEAMEAFGDNKKVYFEVRGHRFEYSGLNVKDGHYLNKYNIKTDNERANTRIEAGVGPSFEHYFHEALIYGKWYTQEDAE